MLINYSLSTLCVFFLYVSAVYDACIFKFDHYCAWTNNCVGGLNHRYFMAFLASLCAMCADAVYLSVRALTNITHIYQLMTLRFINSRGTPQDMNVRVLIQVCICHKQ